MRLKKILKGRTCRKGVQPLTNQLTTHNSRFTTHIKVSRRAAEPQFRFNYSLLTTHNFSLFTLHFSLRNPGVSEAHSFAETCDWRTQGSLIGEAVISEGKTPTIPGFRKRNVSQKRTTGENRDRPYGRGQKSKGYRIRNTE